MHAHSTKSSICSSLIDRQMFTEITCFVLSGRNNLVKQREGRDGWEKKARLEESLSVSFQLFLFISKLTST